MRRIRNFIIANENTFIWGIVCIAMLAFVVIWGVLYSNHLDNQLRNIIDNPTFIGEVVNKKSISRNIGIVPFNHSITYRLHIIGAYMEGDEMIHVDQVFTVTHYWYSKFETGDLIYHSS